MAVHVFVIEDNGVGFYVANSNNVGLVQEDPGVVNTLQHTEVGHECRIGAQQGFELEIDNNIGIAVEIAGVVDVESIEYAVRELVITGSVIGVLEALDAHAENETIGTACFIASESIKVVEIGSLVLEQEWPVSVTCGEQGRTRESRDCRGTPRCIEH